MWWACGFAYHHVDIQTDFRHRERIARGQHLLCQEELPLARRHARGIHRGRHRLEDRHGLVFRPVVKHHLRDVAVGGLGAGQRARVKKVAALEGDASADRAVVVLAMGRVRARLRREGLCDVRRIL